MSNTVEMSESELQAALGKEEEGVIAYITNNTDDIINEVMIGAQAVAADYAAVDDTEMHNRAVAYATLVSKIGGEKLGKDFKVHVVKTRKDAEKLARLGGIRAQDIARACVPYPFLLSLKAIAERAFAPFPAHLYANNLNGLIDETNACLDVDFAGWCWLYENETVVCMPPTSIDTGDGTLYKYTFNWSSDET